MCVRSTEIVAWLMRKGKRIHGNVFAMEEKKKISFRVNRNNNARTFLVSLRPFVRWCSWLKEDENETFDKFMESRRSTAHARPCCCCMIQPDSTFFSFLCLSLFVFTNHIFADVIFVFFEFRQSTPIESEKEKTSKEEAKRMSTMASLTHICWYCSTSSLCCSMRFQNQFLRSFQWSHQRGFNCDSSQFNFIAAIKLTSPPSNQIVSRFEGEKNKCKRVKKKNQWLEKIFTDLRRCQTFHGVLRRWQLFMFSVCFHYRRVCFLDIILGCFDCPESRKLFNAGNEMHSALLNSKQAMMKLTEWSDENNYDVIIIAYFSLPA